MIRFVIKKTKIKDQKFSVGMVSRFDLLNIFDNRLNFEHIYNGWIDQFEFKYLFDLKSNVEHQWFNAVLDFRFFLDIIKLLNKRKLYLKLDRIQERIEITVKI